MRAAPFAPLIDEREGRRCAAMLGIPYFGSLRVLKRAKDAGLVRRIKPTAGTYIHKNLRQEFLREVEES